MLLGRTAESALPMASYGFADAQAAGGDEDAREGVDDAELQPAMHSFLEERDELFSLIASLNDQSNRHKESVFKRITEIVEKYQEQPQLLDPHLENAITPIMQYVRDFSDDIIFIYNCLKLVYIFSKVRGHKTIGIYISSC